VIECSTWQCEAHASELRAQYHVDAREWSLERADEPPEGPIIATYFHYNDIRRRWPHRLREVRFVTIAPDAGLAQRIPTRVRRILVCERDEATAENVTADLSVVLASSRLKIEPVVSEDPKSLIARVGRDAIVVAAPRVWAALDESSRASGQALEATYLIQEEELEALGREFGWESLPVMV
jgi:hypothetical protein